VLGIKFIKLTVNMPASVDYNIIGASPPFTFSVKDENGIEKFESISGGKIYFTASNNGKYTVVISKGNCKIENEIIINNCSVPAPVSCSIPSLALSSVSELKGVFSVNGITDCTNLEFQYSSDIDFTTYSTYYTQCNTSISLTFPSENVYYVRVVKYCNNIKAYSNVVTINLKSNNCYTFAACLGIGNDPDYSTYRINLKEPASENIQFLLSNNSIITVYKGDSFGQEIINISQDCPYIISSNLNLKYCGNLVPTTPVTPAPVNKYMQLIIQIKLTLLLLYYAMELNKVIHYSLIQLLLKFVLLMKMLGQVM